MTELIKYEFLTQNKIYNFGKNFAIFLLFGLTTITIISPYDRISEFGIIFTVVSLPLGLIGIASNFLRSEIDDGVLELLLVSYNPVAIISAKYLTLSVAVFCGFLVNLPIACVLFDIPVTKLLIIVSSGFHLSLISCALMLLIVSIQSYFRKNTNFLSSLLMPLIIPSIILSGILLQGGNFYSLTLLLIGISCIIIPTALYASSYLIANIYNI